MRRKKKVPKSFQNCLWYCNISKMDIERDKKEIITQVLNYGTWEDLKLLFEIYPEKEIKKVIKNPRRGVWLRKVLNFWATIYQLKLKKEIFERAIFR
jgi:hypothetical protein